MRQRLARVHPLTGEPIRPLFVNKRGQEIWPVMGGSEDFVPQYGEGGETDDGTEGSGTDGSTEKVPDDRNPRIKELSDEAARRRRENNELKSSNQQLLEELKQLKAKDQSEVERLKAQIEELQPKFEAALQELETLRLEKAFLTIENGPKWKNPNAALILARSEGRFKDVIAEDGEVDNTAVKNALQGLAKAHPYLVETPAEEKKQPKPDVPTSGHGPSDGAGNPDEAKLVKKYPALARTLGAR